ncbi:hypothetical protein JOM56_013763 [Amanita muscaria]
MPANPVVRASHVSNGLFSGLTVNPLEGITTPSSPAPSVFTPAKPELFEPPFSYARRCLKDVFNKKAPDFHRAQALYQVFIEMASELETTSQFNTVMTRIVTLRTLYPNTRGSLHFASCKTLYPDACRAMHSDPYRT